MKKEAVKGKWGNWNFDSEMNKEKIKWGDTYPKNQFIYTKNVPGPLFNKHGSKFVRAEEYMVSISSE